MEDENCQHQFEAVVIRSLPNPHFKNWVPDCGVSLDLEIPATETLRQLYKDRLGNKVVRYLKECKLDEYGEHKAGFLLSDGWHVFYWNFLASLRLSPLFVNTKAIEVADLFGLHVSELIQKLTCDEGCIWLTQFTPLEG